MMGGLDSSRFISMAIGHDEYKERGVRYTGRHWWGDVDVGDNWPNPSAVLTLMPRLSASACITSLKA